MTLFQEPKIDCHTHVFDPARFPYDPAIPYKPSGQEIGTAAQLRQVMKTYGVSHSLMVQPNSGYGGDNSAMLDAIANDKDRLKGIAIIPFDASVDDLRELKAQGIIGAAFNPTFHGNDYYKAAEPLIRKLTDLDMFMQIQSEHDQLLMYVPWIESIPVKVLIDHLGRPTPSAGLGQPGFAALLELARTRRVSVKLSGYSKFSQRAYPFEDCWPFVRAVLDAFTPENCLWASDWPFLRAPERQDYGPLVELAGHLVPNLHDRRALFQTTPKRLFGFA
ncbi:MAG: amidohydrolase family protein [Pseudolabrys sp.]|nr:amidohydrolase family protein [Pseudolabrys sp.]